MEMKNGMPVYTEMSYASIVEHDTFSTLSILVEGKRDQSLLGPKFEIRTTTREGTKSEIVKFPSYTHGLILIILSIMKAVFMLTGIFWRTSGERKSREYR